MPRIVPGLVVLALSSCVAVSGRPASAHPICRGVNMDASAADTGWTTPWREVPSTPPRGLPRGAALQVFAPENLIEDSEYMTGVYPQDVIWLFFKRTAPLAERQAALDLVGGEVIGGAPFHEGGAYYVRIRNRNGADPLFAAIRQLEALPEVDRAMPDLSCTISTA